MSNCDVYTLPTLEVEPHQVREVLRCLLHTIVFNRALGHVEPKDIDSELFDVTYVHCGDQEVDTKLEAKISEFCAFAEKRPGETAQLVLSFYETKKRQVNWFGKEDRVVWEQWVLNVVVDSPHSTFRPASAPVTTMMQPSRQQQQQAALERAISTILQCVCAHPDHLPPVATHSTPLTYPFHIAITGGSRSAFNLNSMKKMLLNASPPSILG